MEDYRDLKKQIEELIRKGKLQRFVKKDGPGQTKQNVQTKSSEEPRSEDRSKDHLGDAIGEIRMINRRPTTKGSFRPLNKAQQRQVNNVHAMRQSKHQRKESSCMAFTEEDAQGIKQPYDDPLVIMLMIEGFNTRRILVNNRSSANIIYLSTFQQLKVDPKRFHPFESPLVNFNEDKVYLRGIVPLTVTANLYPF